MKIINIAPRGGGVCAGAGGGVCAPTVGRLYELLVRCSPCVAAACTAAASESIGAATSTPTCRGEGGKGEGGG